MAGHRRAQPSDLFWRMQLESMLPYPRPLPRYSPRLLDGPPDPFGTVMESCVTKAVLSYVIGGGMGGLFGLLFSGTAHHQVDTSLSTRQQIVQQWRAMGRSAVSMAKSFAWVGLIFAGTECVIEKARAKSDMYNSLSAGCLSGAFLAYQGGPQAMGLGCVGFMAFSLVIDTIMHPSDPRKKYMQQIPEPKRFRRQSRLEIIDHPDDEDIPLKLRSPHMRSD